MGMGFIEEHRKISNIIPKNMDDFIQQTMINKKSLISHYYIFIRLYLKDGPVRESYVSFTLFWSLNPNPRLPRLFHQHLLYDDCKHQFIKMWLRQEPDESQIIYT